MSYLVLLIFGLLLFAVIKGKTILSPSGILIVILTALVSVLLLFFSSMVEVKYVGLIYMAIGMAVCLAGYVTALKFSPRNIVTRRNIVFKRRLALYVLFSLTLFGFINPVYNIYSHGFSILDLFNFEQITEMSKHFSWERYSDETTYSKFVQLFLIFTYTAPVIGGFCCFLVKKRIHKTLCALTVAPCLLITLSQSTKMQMIVSIFLWIAGLLTAGYTYNIKIKITLKIVIVGICSAIVCMTALFFISLARWNNDIDNKAIVNGKNAFIESSLGSLLCFDHWFYDNIKGIDYSTRLLQNSSVHRWDRLEYIENGIRVHFPEPINDQSLEIIGRRLDDCKYFAGNHYTVQFDIKSNQQLDSARITLVSYSTLPHGHYVIKMDHCEQTGLHTWHYSTTFCLDSTRSCVTTPDLLFSSNHLTYIEVSKFRIDTGSVAFPWINGNSNIFWHKDGLKCGVMTFFGIANLLGIEHRMPGVYRDYVLFSKGDYELRSNVYTIFRMLIDDFGKVGALIFLLLLGFASGKAVVFIQKRKMIFVCQAFLIAVYSYVLWGFVASIWAYTSIIASYVLSFFIFSILQKPLHGDTWVTKITKKLKSKQK